MNYDESNDMDAFHSEIRQDEKQWQALYSKHIAASKIGGVYHADQWGNLIFGYARLVAFALLWTVVTISMVVIIGTLSIDELKSVTQINVALLQFQYVLKLTITVLFLLYFGVGFSLNKGRLRHVAHEEAVRFANGAFKHEKLEKCVSKLVEEQLAEINNDASKNGVMSS